MDLASAKYDYQANSRAIASLQQKLFEAIEQALYAEIDGSKALASDQTQAST